MMCQNEVRLIWHRGRDLRVHDNPLYSNVGSSSSSSSSSWSSSSLVQTASLVIFDPHDFTPRPSTCLPQQWDAITTGPHTTRLLLEAVSNLRWSLRNLGGELIVRIGDPVIAVPLLAQQIRATHVYWNEIPGTYEMDVSRRVREELLLSNSNVVVVTDVSYTLYHPNDLPRESDMWAELTACSKQHNGTKNKQKKKKKKNDMKTKLKKEAKYLHGSDSASLTNDEKDRSTSQRCNLVDVSPQRWIGIPHVMGEFRRAVRTHTEVRPTIQTPDSIRLPPALLKSSSSSLLLRVDDDDFDVGEIPTLEELLEPIQRHYHPKKKPQQQQQQISVSGCTRPLLGMSWEIIQSVLNSAMKRNTNVSSGDGASEVTHGGETRALERLQYFVIGDGGRKAASANRNLADVSGDSSCKFSMHLAMGTLSPRAIYEAVKNPGNSTAIQSECDWIISHLEMRDYFIFTAFAFGSKLYRKDGIRFVRKTKQSIVWKDPSSSSSSTSCDDTFINWKKWTSGHTGFPLIDAAMRELLTTGYCSNRVRQNVASFLTKDLSIDWRAGAEWFQFLLEDHCVGANWGNWLYFSGVGSDPKHRHFRTVSQALRYDRNGAYVKKWLPELKKSPNKGIDKEDEEEAVFRPSVFLENWTPLVADPRTQLTWRDLKRLEESGKLCGDERIQS